MEAKEAFEVVRLVVDSLSIRAEDYTKVQTVMRLLAQLEQHTSGLTQQIQQLQQKEQETDA